MALKDGFVRDSSGRLWSSFDRACRTLVVGRLLGVGPMLIKSSKVWMQMYLKCDGTNISTSTEAQYMRLPRSHVINSSPEAMREVAALINRYEHEAMQKRLDRQAKKEAASNVSA